MDPHKCGVSSIRVEARWNQDMGMLSWHKLVPSFAGQEG